MIYKKVEPRKERHHWNEICKLIKEMRDELSPNPGENDVNDIYRYNNLFLRWNWLVAIDEDKIVGIVGWTIDDSPAILWADYVVAYADYLYVDAKYRKQGVGFALVEAAEKDMKKHRVDHIVLDTSRDMEKFYGKHGFWRTCRMAKDLT